MVAPTVPGEEDGKAKAKQGEDANKKSQNTENKMKTSDKNTEAPPAFAILVPVGASDEEGKMS